MKPTIEDPLEIPISSRIENGLEIQELPIADGPVPVIGRQAIIPTPDFEMIALSHAQKRVREHDGNVEVESAVTTTPKSMTSQDVPGTKVTSNQSVTPPENIGEDLVITIPNPKINGTFETPTLLKVNGLPFHLRPYSSMPDAWIYEQNDNGLLQKVENAHGKFYKRKYVRRDLVDKSRSFVVGSRKVEYRAASRTDDYFVETRQLFMVSGEKFWLYESWVPKDVFFGSGLWFKG